MDKGEAERVAQRLHNITSEKELLREKARLQRERQVKPKAVKRRPRGKSAAPEPPSPGRTPGRKGASNQEPS